MADWYDFDMALAESATALGYVAVNSTVTIYDPNDTAHLTPLGLMTPNGLTQPNPITTTPEGFLPAFRAPLAKVMWSDGTYSGYLTSFTAVWDRATEALETARRATAVQDDMVAGFVLQEGSLTQSAVIAIAGRAGEGGGGGSGPVAVDWTTMPAGAAITITASGTTYPERPTSRTDIIVRWRGSVPPTIGGKGAVNGVDEWVNTKP